MCRLGRRITQLREGQRLSIEAMCRLTGLDAVQLTKIEAGEIDIRLTTIVLIARALGISADQLLAEL